MNLESRCVVIEGIGSISAAGSSSQAVVDSYTSGTTKISFRNFANSQTPVGMIPTETETLIDDIHFPICGLDRSVHLGIFAARKAMLEAHWDHGDDSIGVVIGTSRGPTELLETYHSEFSHSANGTVSPFASPLTTHGNVSSWIASDLQLSGLAISHSVTCSSALHSLVTGVSWLYAGFSDKVLCGGAEAPLTEFTLAQMKALRLYSKTGNSRFPCRPLNFDENSLVLGEGAAVVALSLAPMDTLPPGSLVIRGIGMAHEVVKSPTWISQDGKAFELAMRRAMMNCNELPPVDLVVAHAPGTKRGDSAEICAISRVFGSHPPPVVSPKWCTGHSFGASGALNIEYAALCLSGLIAPSMPYKTPFDYALKAQPSVLMINAAGFGGNAVSVILQRIE